MKDRRATGIALAFAVLLVGGLGLSKIGGQRNPGPQPPVNPSSCLEVRVLASSEKAWAHLGVGSFAGLGISMEWSSSGPSWHAASAFFCMA